MGNISGFHGEGARRSWQRSPMKAWGQGVQLVNGVQNPGASLDDAEDCHREMLFLSSRRLLRDIPPTHLPSSLLSILLPLPPSLPVPICSLQIPIFTLKMKTPSSSRCHKLPGFTPAQTNVRHLAFPSSHMG